MHSHSLPAYTCHLPSLFVLPSLLSPQTSLLHFIKLLVYIIPVYLWFCRCCCGAFCAWATTQKNKNLLWLDTFYFCVRLYAHAPPTRHLLKLALHARLFAHSARTTFHTFPTKQTRQMWRTFDFSKILWSLHFLLPVPLTFIPPDPPLPISSLHLSSSPTLPHSLTLACPLFPSQKPKRTRTNDRDLGQVCDCLSVLVGSDGWLSSLILVGLLWFLLLPPCFL